MLAQALSSNASGISPIAFVGLSSGGNHDIRLAQSHLLDSDFYVPRVRLDPDAGMRPADVAVEDPDRLVVPSAASEAPPDFDLELLLDRLDEEVQITVLSQNNEIISVNYQLQVADTMGETGRRCTALGKADSLK